jgi:HlyD family secretion protein
LSNQLSPIGQRLPALAYNDVVPTLKDDPAPELRIGVIVALVFFVGFLGWAAFAPMDSAAYAPGRVTVAGHRQTVQHREGGVVGAISVREGQHVTKDEVLVQLAGADVQAQERSLAAAVIGLKAQRARLLAEQLGGPIVWPADFATLTGPDLEEAQRAMRVQENQFRARSSTLSTQGGVLGQRNAQLQEQIGGYQKQIASIDEQSRLLTEEVAGMRTLNERGFAPMTKVRELERALAQLQGQKAALTANIAASRERMGETRLQGVELNKTQQEEIAKEIRDVEFQLNDATPKLQAARDMLARTQIRAPATGTVVGLTVFTVGGVIAPGQKVLDVVPDKAPLVLEAQVSPNDADDLQIGQSTDVRFIGIHERDLPRLSGQLSKLSADSFTDEKTGASYFMAEVTVPIDQVDQIRAVRGKDFNLRPGMPVQVLVPLKKRTALQYIMQPLTEAMWRSFREH